MITLESVTKSFMAGSAKKVLMQDVSLALPRGRSVALLGRNGSGKSTLLRMIGGSLEPDAGVIQRHVNISWPLGFVGGFHNALTGAQNIRFIARIYGVDTDDLIAAAAEFAEIGPFLDMPVSTYSSGMRARLAFGVSFGVDFDVYLIDEVTAVGDAAFKKKCAAAFAAKAARADLVMVSHSARTIRDFCDSGVVLERGALTYYADVEDALAAHMENMRQSS